MKTLYGIKQKYNLKDYVKYYQSRDGNGKPCNVQFGWISGIEYRCNVKGEIELTYILADYIGASCGHCIRPDAIIKRATPKVPNYGYRDYLKARITCDENSIKSLEKRIKESKKTLEELDNESRR